MFNCIQRGSHAGIANNLTFKRADNPLPVSNSQYHGHSWCYYNILCKRIHLGTIVVSTAFNVFINTRWQFFLESAQASNQRDQSTLLLPSFNSVQSSSKKFVCPQNSPVKKNSISKNAKLYQYSYSYNRNLWMGKKKNCIDLKM